MDGPGRENETVWGSQGEWAVPLARVGKSSAVAQGPQRGHMPLALQCAEESLTGLLCSFLPTALGFCLLRATLL